MDENDKAPTAAQWPESVPLADALRLENLELRGKLLVEQVRAQQAAFEAAFRDICARHGLPVDRTGIDYQTGKVTVKE